MQNIKQVANNKGWVIVTTRKEIANFQNPSDRETPLHLRKVYLFVQESNTTVSLNVFGGAEDEKIEYSCFIGIADKVTSNEDGLIRVRILNEIKDFTKKLQCFNFYGVGKLTPATDVKFGNFTGYTFDITKTDI